MTGIMKLPCVQSAHKRYGSSDEVAFYLLDQEAMAAYQSRCAHPGEWLVQNENGKWSVETEDEKEQDKAIVFTYKGKVESLKDAEAEEGNVYDVGGCMFYAFLKGKWRKQKKDEYWNPITGERNVAGGFDMED